MKPFDSLSSLRRAPVARRARTISPRVLDMIPGGLAWLALAGVAIGALVVPRLVVWTAALLGVYSALRIISAAAANLYGLHLVRRWQRIDWHAEYHRRAGKASLPRAVVRHLVVIPNYGESLPTLRAALDNLAAQADAPRTMTVVLAMEAAEPGTAAKGARLQREYADRFARLLVVVHPSGLSGEVQCKSANLAWAVRAARRVMHGEMGIKPDHVVVTTMDADTRWHPDTFAALTTLFAVHPARYAMYWQAPMRYHGNVWAVHPLMRILHAYASAWELAYLAAPWWRALPMSSYSLSLRLAHSAGYWDPDVIADEWHMYIKTFFRRAGRVELQPIFLPFQANATAGGTIGQAVRERYLQTLRHAWGAKEIGYTLAQMMLYPARARRSLALLVRVAHDNLLVGAGWVIMMLGAQLPLLLHPAVVTIHSAPFVLLQVSIGVVTLLTVAFWIIDMALRPPRLAGQSGRVRWLDRLREVTALPLLALLTLVCVALPALHAQTRLLLGLPLQFRVSRKE